MVFSIYTDSNEYQPTEEEWRALAGLVNQQITVSLYGKSSADPNAEKHHAPDLTLTIAAANLSVYRMDRCCPDSRSRRNTFPTKPRLAAHGRLLPVFSNRASSGGGR